MSNYIKTVDFAVKDTYAHGDTRKVAKGAEVDTEYNNIATAVTSKQDTSGKGVANGYAGLDASALVPIANIAGLPASAVTSGTFNIARLGSGTPTGHKFLRDDSQLLQVDYTDLSGTQTAAQIPALDASKITTGTFSAALIPGLAGSIITSGTVASARLPNIGTLPGITIQADPGGTPSGAVGAMFFYY